MIDPGTRVRLVGDPGRIGVVGARARERGDITYFQIIFPDATSYVPADQIERVEGGEDPIELLATGRLGRAVDLRRLLTHVRLTGRLANLIYSLDATGTDFYAYQFKPVLNVLESASGGMLIADEVGLGKTIEAGLVWTELRARFDFDRLLVICPSFLREKWCRELSLRFGVEARQAGADEVLTALQRGHGGGLHAGFALVSSLQGLRRRRRRQSPEAGAGSPTGDLDGFLDEVQGAEAMVDLLVIDEAHYMRNPETASWRLGARLRDVSQYALLLSATPIHLRNRDLFQLLRLADEDTFYDLEQFEELIRANSPLVQAREHLLAGSATVDSIQSLLDEALSHPLLRDSRQLSQLRSRVAEIADLREPRARGDLAQSIETANLLSRAVTRTRKRDVTEWRVIRDAVPEFVPMTEAERQFYAGVTEVVRQYATRVAAHEGFLLVTPQRQMASSMAAALDDWRSRGSPTIGGAEDSDLDEADGEGAVGPLVREIIRHVEQLTGLDDLAEHDSKYLRLNEVLRRLFREDPSAKAVLFSFFRPTLEYLRRRLSIDGFRPYVIHGGLEGNLDTIDRFRQSDPPAVLLSSEVGSEGIDLQFARVLINYDLPWNPMKVEQRIGRLDRLGQESSKISIWNLMYAGTIDHRIYTRLLERLRIFERALGGLEPIVGEELRALTIDLLSQNLTPEQEEERIAQTALALENARHREEELEAEAPQLVAYGDYIIRQVNAARELSRRVSGSDLWNYVRDFFSLNYPGCELRRDAENPESAEIRLSTDAKGAFHQFIRDRNLQNTALVLAGTAAVRCLFMNTTSAFAARREEVVNQFHPVIRFVNDQTSRGRCRFHPVVAIELDAMHLHGLIRDGMYVFDVQRWSVSGVHEAERLAFAAASVDSEPRLLDADHAERLVMASAASGRDWLSAQPDCDLESASLTCENLCLSSMDDAYDGFVNQLVAQNHDRADVQLRTLEARFRRQLNTLEAVLRGHRERGRSSLVRATEGRIDALKERVGMRRREIEERRGIRHRKDEVCVGLVKVVGRP